MPDLEPYTVEQVASEIVRIGNGSDNGWEGAGGLLGLTLFRLLPAGLSPEGFRVHSRSWTRYSRRPMVLIGMALSTGSTECCLGGRISCRSRNGLRLSVVSPGYGWRLTCVKPRNSDRGGAHVRQKRRPQT